MRLKHERAAHRIEHGVNLAYVDFLTVMMFAPLLASEVLMHWLSITAVDGLASRACAADDWVEPR